MILKAYFQNEKIEAGCDEAGRGCLAGPVFAAAVILPKGFKNNLLNDSKQLSESHRNELKILIESTALAWAVGQADPVEIDEINILNASFLAMHRAIKGLKTKPELLLIDGNRFKPYPDIPYKCIIKGDGKFASIAAASILAKTYRDAYMQGLSEKHPQYDWHKNKGYPTVAHRRAIHRYGDTIHHRKSFRLLPDPVQGNLFLK